MTLVFRRMSPMCLHQRKETQLLGLRKPCANRSERQGRERNANATNWTAPLQAEDMAHFRADLCLYSPESYTLKEKRDICNEMVSSSKAVLDAMRADFERYPPESRSKLLDMLCQSGIESLSKSSRQPRMSITGRWFRPSAPYSSGLIPRYACCSAWPCHR